MCYYIHQARDLWQFFLTQGILRCQIFCLESVFEGRRKMLGGKKIIFLGDSITDAGHNFQPVREGEAGLGDGYVRRIAAMLEAGPADTDVVDIRNAGHDGFTVQGLLRMLEWDCLRHSPDVVSILVGCNDAAVCMNTGRTLDETGFAESYKRLLRRIREGARARIICMGPFIFPCPLEYRNWIPLIREIEAAEQEAAREAGALFIPLHALLNREAEGCGVRPDHGGRYSFDRAGCGDHSP